MANQEQGAFKPEQEQGAFKPEQEQGAFKPEQEQGAFKPEQEQGAFKPEQEQVAFQPELDQPRRTTEHQVETTETEKSGSLPTSTTEEGGYGGVSEQEPPHHKIHTDDEPLPKPQPGTYDDDVQEEQPREEQVTPSATSDRDFRSKSEPKAIVDETPASEPRSFGEEKNEAFSDPSTAFPDAPVDRKVEEPGYGQDLKSSEPLSTDETPGSPAPKKEGLMTKIKEKLPGHHKTSSTPETVEDADTPLDSPSAPPKKGLMAKIKEKLPGHHATPIATQ